MDEILNSSNNVLLKTSLDEEMFAKTKFSNLLEETGFLVTEKSSGNENFSFREWKFSSSRTIEGEVFFEGEGFEGKTISSILKDANSGDENAASNAKKVLFTLVKIYTQAIEKEIRLPVSGVFGIIYSEDADSKNFLFMPEKTFDRCAANLGKKAYCILQEPWRDSALTGKDSLIFSRAVAAYFTLTKNLPYPPQETDKSVNISYSNFLPLEYAVNGIDRKLASVINKNLSGNFKDSSFPLETFEKELFSPEERKNLISTEEFEKAKSDFLSKQNKKITGKRKFNRIKGSLAVTLIAFVFLAIFMINAAGENSKKPVTIGLTSEETVKVFYQGLHHMDTDLLLCSAKICPEAQVYISTIPQIYVSANMRSAFNFESGISTPENWMFFMPGSSRAYSHFIYGLSNFTVDGKNDTLNRKIPTRKNHKKPLLKENGKRLDDFSRAEHTVHYYLVHNVDGLIQIDEYTTVVSLKWIKNTWQISFLNEDRSTITLDPGIFAEDYKNVLPEGKTEEEIDFIEASQKLKDKYPWIPTVESLSEEKKRLDAIGYYF